jgi:hypothetical protein
VCIPLACLAFLNLTFMVPCIIFTIRPTRCNCVG